MPSATEVYAGQYLNAKLVDTMGLAGKPLTIIEAKLENVSRDSRDQEKKIVLSFVRIEKKLALNKGNAKTMVENYGDDYDKWKSCRISLEIVDRQFGGETVPGIKVEPL